MEAILVLTLVECQFLENFILLNSFNYTRIMTNMLLNQKNQVVKVSPGGSSRSLSRSLSRPLSRSLSRPLSRSLSRPCLTPCLAPCLAPVSLPVLPPVSLPVSPPVLLPVLPPVSHRVVVWFAGGGYTSPL